MVGPIRVIDVVFVLFIMGTLVYLYIKNRDAGVPHAQWVQKPLTAEQQEIARNSLANGFHQAQILGELRQKDPTFNESLVESRAREMFTLWYRARRVRSTKDVEHFLDKTLKATLSDKVRAERERGWLSHYDDLNLEFVECVGAERRQENDVIIVRIVATAIRYVEVESTKEVVFGSPKMRIRFVDLVTMIKRHGVVAPIERTALCLCPNCNAPVERKDSQMNCAYCGVELNNPKYDWVLLNLEHSSEL